MMLPDGSPFPWQTANDADFNIAGRMTPQDTYRTTVWGNPETFLYTRNPEDYSKQELITPWGFPVLLSCWNYTGRKGKPVELAAFFCAEEVEIYVNGESIGRKSVSRGSTMPGSVCFETVYRPGRVKAVSYTGGTEVSRAVPETAGPPERIRLLPEKKGMRADGHDLIHVNIQIEDAEGRVVPDAEIRLSAEALGQG